MRPALITLGLIVAVYLAIGCPSPGEIWCNRTLIDSHSGDIKSVHMLGWFTFSGPVSQTEFSRLVRRYQHVESSPDWHVARSVYSPSGMREDCTFTGAIDECDLAAKRIERPSLDEQTRAALTATYLDKLKNGQIEQMNLSSNDIADRNE